MLMRLRFGAVLVALFMTACASQQGKSGSPFRFNAARVEIGTTYHYIKTNLGNSHPEHISVYVAGPDRIESFKFHPGQEPAGLVLATIRWDIGSVQRLESWSVYGDGHRTLVATLEYRPEAQAVDVAFPALNRPTERIAIGRLPYYVFNFDLSDLNFAFRHRKAPTAPLAIGPADPTFAEDGPLFAYRGEVRLEYLGEVLREGKRCRKYLPLKPLEARTDHSL